MAKGEYKIKKHRSHMSGRTGNKTYRSKNKKWTRFNRHDELEFLAKDFEYQQQLEGTK